jgi:hypothetical protein
MAWEDGTLACLITRSRKGHLCGYVGVPAGHPLHGQSVSWGSDLGFDVHGGITWSRAGADLANCPEEWMGWWFVGFDCHHLYDFSPSDPGMSADLVTYCSIGYVRRSVELLARNIREASP